jgi:hypothetical protein
LSDAARKLPPVATSANTRMAVSRSIFDRFMQQ